MLNRKVNYSLVVKQQKIMHLKQPFFFLKENNEHTRKIHLSVEGVTLSWKDLIRA